MALFAAGCSKPDDRTQIERLIRSAVQASKDRSPNDILARVAEDFKGPRGASRRDAKRMLVGRLVGDRWLYVVERSLDVQVEGKSATAALRVLLAEGNAVKRLEDLVPTDASALRFDLRLAKRDGEWWVIAAEYKREGLTP